MAQDWSRYWRVPGVQLEAMHAHFETTVYHRHSHEGYSFGVTEDGAQSFRCRGGGHTSASGMVMAFNPDDPHDGHAADESGFTYRIVHVGTDLVAAALTGITGGRAALPLFARPVHADPVLAAAIRALHQGLAGGVSALRRDELLTDAVSAMTRRASTRPAAAEPAGRAAGPQAAHRAPELLDAAALADTSAAELAAAAGCSRFALHRSFVAAYGMTPAGYQRQLRLRLARRLIASGCPIGETAARAGFADQSHLTRWFGRYYAITPGAYRRAGAWAEG
jgi:AraC-like DNA-binding protein